MREARNTSGALLNQYFSSGQTISGSNYLYTKDHLGSVRELTNSSGTIQTQFAYDPAGRTTQLQGSVAPDFQYAGYYYHGPSGLNLPVYRVFSPFLGTWINRDPLGESGGTNLYGYVHNYPLLYTDSLGLLEGLRQPYTPTPLEPFEPPPVIPGLQPIPGQPIPGNPGKQWIPGRAAPTAIGHPPRSRLSRSPGNVRGG